MIDRNLLVHHLADQLLPIVNSAGHTGDQHWLSVKPGHLYLLVCRYDDAVTSLNLFICQTVFHPDSSVSLYFYGIAQFLRCLF